VTGAGRCQNDLLASGHGDAEVSVLARWFEGEHPQPH